ncbi:uncharacterized protein METZ01_LOCUS442262, partial [marine metagenome]
QLEQKNISKSTRTNHPYFVRSVKGFTS